MELDAGLGAGRGEPALALLRVAAHVGAGVHGLGADGPSEPRDLADHVTAAQDQPAAEPGERSVQIGERLEKESRAVRAHEPGPLQAVVEDEQRRNAFARPARPRRAPADRERAGRA